MQAVSATELLALQREKRVTVLDVRPVLEYRAGHIRGACHVPLAELAPGARAPDPARPVAVICASGYRSSIATSVLERSGFSSASNVVGGMNAWSGAGYETTA